jgi:hypothetical protein
MKHLKKITFFLMLALLLPATATAHDFEVDGIYYDINGNKASVTYRGTNYDTYSDEYIGNVVIPATVTYNGATYTVTAIGAYAFSSCSSLTSITIPSSVTSIGSYAFNYCISLAGVLSIPNSVTYIGRGAFYGCSALTGELKIPNSITMIETETFRYCSGLTSLVIPNSVKSIDSHAFGGCTALSRVTIGNSVTSIDYNAFSSCTGLTSVHITDLTSWCKIAFITSDSNPLYYANHLFLNGVEVRDLIIPSNISDIGNYAFTSCKGLTSVTITT